MKICWFLSLNVMTFSALGDEPESVLFLKQQGYIVKL